MVLDDIAYGADLLLKANACPDAKTLCHGDLHAVHMMPIPQRFQKGIGKPEIKQVLYGLLSEKMIDPEY